MRLIEASKFQNTISYVIHQMLQHKYKAFQRILMLIKKVTLTYLVMPGYFVPSLEEIIQQWEILGDLWLKTNAKHKDDLCNPIEVSIAKYVTDKENMFTNLQIYLQSR